MSRFLPPKTLLKGVPHLKNRCFAAGLDACALGPGARQAEKSIPLGSQCNATLAAKGKDKNQREIENNMEWQKLTFRFFKPTHGFWGLNWIGRNQFIETLGGNICPIRPRQRATHEW